MKLIHQPADLSPGDRKVCLAIGFFDGVHLGHQQIIRQTIADARQHDALALTLTFDGHPNSVVAPDRLPPLIYSLPQRLHTIESLGCDALLLIHFDHAFSQQTGEVFIRSLAHDLGGIHSLCVGAEFAFGYRRSGNVDLLRRLGSELHFEVHGLAAVSLDGKVVSSTRIREAIRTGHFKAAGQLLGRAYALAGRVVRGDRLGHQLGFPTANLDVAGLVLPPTGVYTARVGVRGTIHRAVVNIGYRPTLRRTDPQLRVEAHLLDFQGEICGETMEISFIDHLRDEMKFASLEDLKVQIVRDVDAAKTRF
jgi:riboflavin kinase / FMN adenylyltransferase